MFLKRLEINGFKSFAHKTGFDFGSGIVCIVGPNGSGKSNITDGIRWILGEREAKNLRGDTIEDLIFAGTPKKARASMASVSLVFDNTSGALPFDYKEVVISRSIARNGVSEYAINNSSVRLKDIIDFFSKIKLGAKGLTIISQGSGDAFVKASIEERMAMVEEILGLREYQIKKNDAQRKLKNTRINLERAKAVMEEVGPRLRVLKRQTAKWEKRFEIEQELTSIEGDYYASKIKDLLHKQKTVGDPQGDIIKRQGDYVKALAEVEERLQKLEQQSQESSSVRVFQEQKKQLLTEQLQKEREIYKIESELERLQQTTSAETHFTLSEAHQTLTSLRLLFEDALSALSWEHAKQIIQKGHRLVADLFEPKQPTQDTAVTKEQLLTRCAGLKTELEKITAKMGALEQQEQQVSQHRESYNAQLRSIFSQREEIKDQLKKCNDQLQTISFEKEKIAFKLEELQAHVVASNGSWEEYVTLAKNPTFDKHFSHDELETVERRIMRLRGELASIGDVDEALIKETQDVETHYAFLSRESVDLEKALEDLETLIKDLNTKIATEFSANFKHVNDEFNTFFRMMFGGGSAHMKIVEKKKPSIAESVEGEQPALSSEVIDEDDDGVPCGIDVVVSIPQKKITSLEMLSGGERSLVSLAVLFALVAVSPPPFLVLDEADSALDEKNSRRFSELIKHFSSRTQFIMVTHNRVTMEVADALYGVTMDEVGTSKILSLKLSN